MKIEQKKDKKDKKEKEGKINEKKHIKKEDSVDYTVFDINRFLHEPNRLQIIAILYSTEYTDMLYLKKTLELTWGNLSSHLAKLEKKDYIVIKKEFIGKKPYTLIEITKVGKEKFENYRKNMKNFLFL